MSRKLRSPFAASGGLTRTYGLGRYFTKPQLEGPPPRISKAGISRIGKIFWPYRSQCVLVLVCIGVTSGLGVLPPFFVRLILDRAMPEGDLRLLGWLAAAMVAIALLSGLISVFQQFLTARVGQGIMFDLQNALYRHLQQMSLQFYTATFSGEIVSRINNDVSAVRGVTRNTLVAIATNFATLLAASVALISMNWKLALIAVGVVPIFYLPSKIVGNIRRRLSAETQEAQASLLVFMNEHLHVSGALLTKLFGQSQADARIFTERSARVRDLHIRQDVVGRWLFMILSVFSALGPALIYWYGGYQVIHQEISVGTLIAFAALLILLYRPLVGLATVYTDIQIAIAVFERIFGYLDMEAEVKDRRQAISLEQAVGHVVFENVYFSYPPSLNSEVHHVDDKAGPGSDTFALYDVSFEIRPGEQVALVGPSGAGKTTITYLVPRFYDAERGQISLDGKDLRELKQEDLRRQIGMVTQDTHLFHASVRENLLYAKPESTDEEIVVACRAANIHDFIAALPDGYGTIVGERGFRLSGGEKQRVSIARALLKGAPILILDEPTSHLDATSEHFIQQALDKLLRNRTSLIIAHRLSTILSSDKIVVLNDGRVVEVGHHKELLQHGGLYAQLFNQQFGDVLQTSGR